jgi:L-cysteine:1D-myo-inositol 2-amino-2-deoxy-alpha-D-glucopyranoside ligase
MLDIFSERGGDPDRRGKRDPLDCLLWQSKREGEPSWDTELGPGRPGWHVECAAIAMHYLGRTFDVQGGGSDLAFPHHEMSAAEGHVAFPDEGYARLSVHAGMVGLCGHKMSKSRGNLVLVSRLRAQGVDPRAIRLALLAQHYRSDWEWTPDLVVAGERRLAAWSRAARRAAGDPVRVARTVQEAMANDLDAPAALSAVDAWAAERGRDADEERPVDAKDDEVRLLAAVIEESLGVALL